MKALADYLARTSTSQVVFAARVGVSQPTISNLVKGVHSASGPLLKRIARETGLSIDQLLADDDASTSSPTHAA